MIERTMTLSQCAKHDFETGARNRLTGWGIICKERHEKKISRKQKRLLKKGGN